jgi:hypothetical protein
MAGLADRAHELIDRASTRAERNGEGATRIHARFARALVVLELGPGGAAEAEALLLEALTFAGEQQRLNWELMLSIRLAALAERTGKLREAHERLAGHYALLTEGFGHGTAREAKATLDELSARLAAGTPA